MNRTTQYLIIIALVLALTLGGATVALARPIKNNNPGDLRWDGSTQWQGQTGVDDENFIIFDTLQNGMRASAITALHYFTQDGIVNLTDFGNRWAPPSDNNGNSGYGAALAARIGVDPDAAYDYQNQLPALLSAIFHNEDVLNPAVYDTTDIQTAASIALGANA